MYFLNSPIIREASLRDADNNEKIYWLEVIAKNFVSKLSTALKKSLVGQTFNFGVGCSDIIDEDIFIESTLFSSERNFEKQAFAGYLYFEAYFIPPTDAPLDDQSNTKINTTAFNTSLKCIKNFFGNIRQMDLSSRLVNITLQTAPTFNFRHPKSAAYYKVKRRSNDRQFIAYHQGMKIAVPVSSVLEEAGYTNLI